jgi:hypothetical protein
MVRKILAGILIAISSTLLGLSIAGITLVWMYKEPLTQVSTARLRSIDNLNWNAPCARSMRPRKAWRR